MTSPQRPSSPLAFPSSSPAVNVQGDDVSSPLRFPQTSSPIRHSQNVRSNVSSDLLLGPSSSAGSRHPSTPRTPRFRRGDLHASQDVTRQFHQEPATASADPTSSQANDPTAATRIIWGTLVDIQESTNTFKKFLRLFKLATRLEAEGRPVTPADNEPFYPKLLTQLKRQESYNLNLDCANLRAYPATRKLYEQLVKYPQELIPLMDYTLSEFFCELFDLDEYDEQNRGFKVRPYNLKESVNMRSLNPSDIDKLVTVKGILIRASTVIPDLKQAFFRCLECDHAVTVGIDRGKITEPTRCPREACNSLNTMSLIHNRCDFTDKQICRLQETPDAIPDGQTPHTVSLCMYDDLVDVAKPGDRLEVTGIFRSIPVRVNPRMRTIKTLFKTYLDVVHIQKSDKKRMAVDPTLSSGNEFAVDYDESDEIRSATQEDETKIRELATNPNIYDILAKSLAPSIYELEDIKKGILLQLFGGTNKVFKKSGAPRYRGDVNVLLVGDPGTSKSQMLTYVHKIAPRGVYTSGKGSSAVGLTAYVTRDPDTKQLVLESGALVLSDGGVCCIDEFDKMSDATRSVLHEVMEQQTVSVAKAGIITTLNARTSILACANPKFSRWNPRLPIPQNIDLPPTLLSRFDLVYILLDKPDENADRRLARHLVGLYLEDVPSIAVPDTIPVELLTKYIGYARSKVHPTLTDGAEKLLIESYVKLRNLGENSRGANSRVTATTRQLESMIRLSEAHARMRLSPTVEEHDVEEACRLLREAIKESATDPATGLIDMDLINTGTSAFTRFLLNDMQRELQRMILSKSAVIIKWTGLYKEFTEQSSFPVNVRDFETVLDNLQQEGIIKVSGSRENRVIRRTQGPIDGGN